MSVAKTGAIPNSYRQIHIAVDDFENRILKGRINHESKEYGIVFYSLSEMELALEELFEEIQYPMKSVDHRNFSKKEYLELFPREWEHFQMVNRKNVGQCLSDFWESRGR